MAKLKCPDGAGGIAVGGSEYAADEHGVVTIPDEFADAAQANGYTVPQEVPEEVHE